MGNTIGQGSKVRSQAIRAFDSSARVLIITHEHPDGDALGSSLALSHALNQRGIESVITCVDPAPTPFQFLPGIRGICSDCLLGNFDTIAIVDCGDLKRTGMPERVRAIVRHQRRVINIDHHQRNDLHKLVTINYVDQEASSAAELMLPLIEALGCTITPSIATCLLTGLYNDTGGFKHSNTSMRVLEQAAQLMLAGASLKDISMNIASFRSVPALRLWGIALSRIQRHPVLGLMTSVITREDFKRADAFEEDLAGCVNLINTVPGARATILFYEQANGRIKASVRTENNAVDVSRLANLFGGGGIKKAAGFSFEGHFEQSGGQWLIAPGCVSATPITLPVYQPIPSYEPLPMLQQA